MDDGNLILRLGETTDDAFVAVHQVFVVEGGTFQSTDKPNKSASLPQFGLPKTETRPTAPRRCGARFEWASDPVGSSSKMLASRSPYAVMANVLGIGVAVITKM